MLAYVDGYQRSDDVVRPSDAEADEEHGYVVLDG